MLQENEVPSFPKFPLSGWGRKKKCMLKHTVHINNDGRCGDQKSVVLCVEAWHNNLRTEVALPHLRTSKARCDRTHNALQDSLILYFLIIHLPLV
jgi:hypothetical protein